MYVYKVTTTVTTDGSGAATEYSPKFTGEIRQIVYTAVDYLTSVDFTITVEGTGESVWSETNVSASKVIVPRIAVHLTTAAGAVYASAGEPVTDRIAVANDRLKFVLAQAGASHSGIFTIIVS